MDHSPLAALANYLATLPPSTSIEGEVESTIIELLRTCWPSLEGSSDQETEAYKLIGRVENLTWAPPNLCFVHARHGGAGEGSSRAEIYHWEVDVSSGVAKIVKKGQRQLSPRAERVDTLALAQETAKLMLSKIEHPSIQWVEPGVYAVVQISQVIPPENTYKQTLAGQRKRYRDHLEEIMAGHGWVRKDKGNLIGFQSPAVK